MKIVWSIFIGEEEVHESTLEIDDNATEKEIDNEIISAAINHLTMGKLEEDT